MEKTSSKTNSCNETLLKSYKLQVENAKTEIARLYIAENVTLGKHNVDNLINKWIKYKTNGECDINTQESPTKNFMWKLNNTWKKVGPNLSTIIESYISVYEIKEVAKITKM